MLQELIGATPQLHNWSHCLTTLINLNDCTLWRRSLWCHYNFCFCWWMMMVIIDYYDDSDDNEYHNNDYFMSFLIHLLQLFVNIRVDHLLIAMYFPIICAILQWHYMNAKPSWITHNSTAYLSLCKVINHWPFREGCPAVTGGGKYFHVITSSCSFLFSPTWFCLKGHGSRITIHIVICVYL